MAHLTLEMCLIVVVCIIAKSANYITYFDFVCVDFTLFPWSARLLLDRFPLNLMLRTITKIYRGTSNFIKFRQICRAFLTKNKRHSSVAGQTNSPLKYFCTTISIFTLLTVTSRSIIHVESIVAFPLQQWTHERTAMLPYTYIAYLVSSSVYLRHSDAWFCYLVFSYTREPTQIQLIHLDYAESADTCYRIPPSCHISSLSLLFTVEFQNAILLTEAPSSIISLLFLRLLFLYWYVRRRRFSRGALVSLRKQLRVACRAGSE